MNKETKNKEEVVQIVDELPKRETRSEEYEEVKVIYRTIGEQLLLIEKEIAEIKKLLK